MSEKPSRAAEHAATYPSPQQASWVPREGRPWTVADLEALPDEDNHYELVRGDLLKMTPANPEHGMYASRFDYAIRAFAEQHDLGEVYTADPGFQLAPEPEPIVRCPDVAFVRRDRIPEKSARAFWALAPDLVVEIISDSEPAAEIESKVEDYRAAGVKLIWLVYPRTQTVVEHRGDQLRRFTKRDSLDGGEVLPGFALPLANLFR
jgi:Uma2 family endonuclease